MFFVAIYIFTKMPGFKTLMSLPQGNQSFVSFTVSVCSDVIFFNIFLHPGVLSDKYLNHHIFYFAPFSHPAPTIFFIPQEMRNLVSKGWLKDKVLHLWNPAGSYLSVGEWGDGTEICIVCDASDHCASLWPKRPYLGRPWLSLKTFPL